MGRLKHFAVVAEILKIKCKTMKDSLQFEQNNNHTEKQNGDAGTLTY